MTNDTPSEPVGEALLYPDDINGGALATTWASSIDMWADDDLGNHVLIGSVIEAVNAAAR